MIGKLSENFHGVGIGPLSKILAVKKNIREKKRRFKIRESCDEFVITQFKSYFRPPKSASEV